MPTPAMSAGNGTGSNAPPIAAPETRGRAQIENSGKYEVGALAPTLTTDRKRTDRVASPIVAVTRGSDHGESGDEQRPGNYTAKDLSRPGAW
jgi:hypothetical protein